MSEEEKKVLPRRVFLTGGAVAISSGSCVGNGKESEAPGSVNFTPADPSTLKDEELTIISAETRLPVPGARVSGPFEGSITDDAGRVTVKVGEGYPLEINLDGFLPRQTRFTRNRTTVSLWPIVAEDDRHFPALLYFKGELRSLQASRIAVSFGSGVSDQRIITAHELAITKINKVLDGKAMFGSRPSSAQVVINVSVNSKDPEFDKNPMWGGYTSLSVLSDVIKGATIVYRDIQRAIDLAHHELGHCLGLGHVSDLGSWMMDPNAYYQASDFTETEKRAICFSLTRQPGWLPLDNDRDLFPVEASSLDRRSHLIGC